MLEALLVVHIIVCIALVGSILMQRSEGGGALGIGGGPSGLMSSRGAANFMTRTTAVLATLFFCTSIGLVLASGGGKTAGSSVMGTGRTNDGLPTKSIEFAPGTGSNDAAAQQNSVIPQSEAAPTAPANNAGSAFDTSVTGTQQNNSQNNAQGNATNQGDATKK